MKYGLEPVLTNTFVSGGDMFEVCAQEQIRNNPTDWQCGYSLCIPKLWGGVIYTWMLASYGGVRAPPLDAFQTQQPQRSD